MMKESSLMRTLLHKKRLIFKNELCIIGFGKRRESKMDDLKNQITTVVTKIQKDPNIAESFKTNPVKTVEDLIGVDLPDDKINAVIDGVKAKLTADTATGMIDKIKGLF